MSSKDHPDWWRPVGGQNSQDSTLERRSLVWNDDENIIPADRVRVETSENYKGKFFTRGCRGMIESIQVYCQGDAVDTLTLRYSPHPCLGPFGEVSIIPAAGLAWQNFVIEEMWNYDSLFIWIYACTVNITWVYDAFQPHDGHESEDAGATWEDMAIRPFIRAVYTGETPGDVPVSGVVNNIPIPSVAAEVAAAIIPNIVTNTWTDICDFDGAGTMLEAGVSFDTSTTPTAGLLPAAVQYAIRIYVDGGLPMTKNNRIICQSEVATFGRCSMGEFYQATVAEPAYDITRLVIRLPIQFRRNITIQALQSTGGPVTTGGHILANVIQ